MNLRKTQLAGAAANQRNPLTCEGIYRILAELIFAGRTNPVLTKGKARELLSIRDMKRSMRR